MFLESQVFASNIEAYTRGTP